MGTRGKKSLAETLIKSGPNGVMAMRPDAPYTLTDAESEEWRKIVGAMQPDYFAPSHYAMLSQLCRHIVASNRIAQLVEDVCSKKRIIQCKLQSLLSMQSVESGAIIRLCRQLRLSHQAIYRADATGKNRPAAQQTIEAPWLRESTDKIDDDAEED